jgi:hypothetical protein
MTSAVGARPGPSAPTEGHGARHRRSGQRWRNLERGLALLVLLLAFVTTVVLLGLQWLGSQGSASSAPVFTQTGASHLLPSEVNAS